MFLSSDCVFSVCFSSDGKQIASGSFDTTVKIWNASSGELQSTLAGDNAVFCVSFSADGKTIAAGDGDILASSKGGNVRLYDVQTGEVKSTLTGHRYVPSL